MIALIIAVCAIFGVIAGVTVNRMIGISSI